MYILTVNKIPEDAVKYAVNQVSAIDSHTYDFQNSIDAPIFGGSNGLDSLNFAFFVVSIEQYVKDTTGIEITLFDDYVFGLDPQDPNHPFANIKNLKNFVDKKIAASQK